MHAHPVPRCGADRRLKWTTPLRFAARIMGAGTLLLSLTTAAAPANTRSTNAPAATETPMPKSVFVDDPRNGKDPFFPKSTRRVATHSSAPVNTASEVLEGTFSLQGLSFANGRKLALINRRTLAEGEEMDVKTKSGVARLRCVEIRDRSVVISVRGATQEIFLRTGL